MKIEYDGKNGEQIATALKKGLLERARQSFQEDIDVVVNTDHTGPSLSLSKVYGQVHTSTDMWRVPVGFSLNTDTGEVSDKEDLVWAYEDLVKL